jgi:8-oxo-dGTP pyrophosphatase MutT (NUDIX family)
MNRRGPVRDAVSAGGVVWRRSEADGIEVVLCGRTSDQVWGLPKGTPDDGETVADTALREVQEETGLRVRLGEKIGTIEYWFSIKGERIHKRVHHYLMEPVGGNVSDHDHEFDCVEWVPIAEARRRLTYPNERRILNDAAERLGVES